MAAWLRAAGAERRLGLDRDARRLVRSGLVAAGWVEDCWNGSYRGAPSDGSAWESGECSQRVLRGSSWINRRFPRSAARALSPAVNRDGLIGFRVARTLTP